MSIRPLGWMWPNRRWCSALEGLAGGGGGEARTIQGHPHRPLLAVVAQVDFAFDRRVSGAKTVAGQRVAGARLELAKARVEAARSSLSRSATKTCR